MLEVQTHPFIAPGPVIRNGLGHSLLIDVSEVFASKPWVSRRPFLPTVEDGGFCCCFFAGMLVTLGFWFAPGFYQWLGAFHIGHFPLSGTLLLQGLDSEHKTHPRYGGPMEGALFASSLSSAISLKGASNAPLTRGRLADGRKSRNSHSKAAGIPAS